MANGFTFNGVHSKTKYIKAISAPRAILPQQKTEIVEIPFSSNAYAIADESYRAEKIPINCFLTVEGKSLFEIGREWAQWLHTATWANLVFDDDPSFTYKAMCIASITPDDLRSPIVTIEFICTIPEVTP